MNATGQLVRKVNMFPLEIVLRNVAAGHFCSRLGVEEGLPLKEPVLEYFIKNDDLHDPFVNDDDLVALGVCTRQDLAEIAPLARKINEALIEIFAKIDVKLVDFKIEMGRATDGTLLLADEITPDSCRLWDQKDHSGKVEHLDKDLFPPWSRQHHSRPTKRSRSASTELDQVRRHRSRRSNDYYLASPLGGEPIVLLISRKVFPLVFRVYVEKSRL